MPGASSFRKALYSGDLTNDRGEIRAVTGQVFPPWYIFLPGWMNEGEAKGNYRSPGPNSGGVRAFPCLSEDANPILVRDLSQFLVVKSGRTQGRDQFGQSRHITEI
jgi:hypothetical protein